MGTAVIQRKERPFNMRPQNARSLLARHFLCYFSKKGMNMLKSIRGVGRAEGCCSNGGKIFS